MTREEIWVTFAMGAMGQWPTATLVANAADDMMQEFYKRFPHHQKQHERDEEDRRAESSDR